MIRVSVLQFRSHETSNVSKFVKWRIRNFSIYSTRFPDRFVPGQETRSRIFQFNSFYCQSAKPYGAKVPFSLSLVISKRKTYLDLRRQFLHLYQHLQSRDPWKKSTKKKYHIQFMNHNWTSRQGQTEKREEFGFFCLYLEQQKTTRKYNINKKVNKKSTFPTNFNVLIKKSIKVNFSNKL